MNSFVLWFNRQLASLLEKLLVVAAVLLMLQLPQIMRQYYDALTGARVEAMRNVGSLEDAAARVNLSLKEYRNRHASSGDAVIRETAVVIDAALQRLANYDSAIMALNGANILTRPFVFLSVLDRELFAAVKFEPGLPLTLEAAVYGLMGIVFASVLWWLLALPFRSRGRTPARV